MATILGTNTLVVEIKGFQQGQQTFTALSYYPTVDPDDATPAILLAGQWESDNLTNLRNCLSADFLLDRITYKKWQGAYYDIYDHPLGLPGLVAGDGMPVYNSQGLVKVVDNSTIDPPGAPAFRNGAIRLPGMPESHQENGAFTAAAISVLDTFRVGVIDISYGGEYFNMYIYRNPDTIPGVSVPNAVEVSGIVVGKPGTQNTRK